MLSGPEPLAGHRGHMGVSKQLASQVGGRVHARSPEERRYIRVRIKRAPGEGAADSGDCPQAIDYMVTKPDVLLAHVFDALLRALQSRDRRLLSDRGRV